MTNILKTERLKTDILIIGGGTAGCYAAVTIAEHSDAKVLICEKATEAGSDWWKGFRYLLVLRIFI